MNERIVQNLISRLGQSQAEREPVELAPHYADVDERTPRDLLLFLRELAAKVHYEPLPRVPPAPPGDWSSFFDYTDEAASRLPEAGDGTTTPHLALIIAFLKLYEIPREQINRLTGRHLEFFYERVLRSCGGAVPPARTCE